MVPRSSNWPALVHVRVLPPWKGLPVPVSRGQLPVYGFRFVAFCDEFVSWSLGGGNAAVALLGVPVATERARAGVFPPRHPEETAVSG